MPGRFDLPARDQEPTGFTQILQNIIDALPGAAAAALVDEWGECVDYAGVLAPFEIRIAAAHMQIELRNANEGLGSNLGLITAMTVCGQRRTFAAYHLIEDYFLVLVFTGGAPLRISQRALSQARYDMRVEGGWEPPPDMERWIHLHVDAKPHDRWRPRRVQLAGAWHEVDVIGAVVGLAEGERGFRVRTGSGAEMTLVRERLGHWYADVRY